MPNRFDAPSARPQASQVSEHLREWIIDNGAGGGSRLPSIRQLTRQLNVGRNAVIEAYEHLIAQGLVRSRPGSGFFVADNPAQLARETSPISLAEVTRDSWRLFEQDDQGLKLGCGWLPDSWREMDDLAYAIRSVTRRSRADILDYSSPMGTPLLRELIQERIRMLGVEADANQILLTGGGSHALDLLVRLLVQPDDTVLVESPGYYNLIGLLRLQRANIIGVPRLADGPDVEQLEVLLRRHRPRLLFTNTAFQNPTGTTLTASVAHRVLQLAERHDVQVVEDDIYADFQHTPTPRLAALDGLQRVIYIGSFSKSLSCSLRVGFIAARPELLRSLVDIKMLTSISSPRFAEQVLATMLQNGSYRKLVERLRIRLANQMAASLVLLRHAGWEIFAEPAGGMFIWARFPGAASSHQLVSNAHKAGIRLSSGQVFMPDNSDSPWLRINVAYAEDPRAIDFLTSPLGE